MVKLFFKLADYKKKIQFCSRIITFNCLNLKDSNEVNFIFKIDKTFKTKFYFRIKDVTLFKLI